MFKKILMGIGILVVIGAIASAAGGGGNDKSTTTSAPATQQQSTTQPAAQSKPTEQPKNKPTISKAEFDQIQSGMTYEQVVQIIGGPGEVLSESGNKGDQFHTVIYSFKGEGDLGANANFTFQGEKLINKAQFGLK